MSVIKDFNAVLGLLIGSVNLVGINSKMKIPFPP